MMDGSQERGLRHGTFCLAQCRNDGVDRRHGEFTDAAFGHGLGVDEAGFVRAGAVLHAHDLLEG
jgi:hypothetical protein